VRDAGLVQVMKSITRLVDGHTGLVRGSDALTHTPEVIPLHRRLRKG